MSISAGKKTLFSEVRCNYYDEESEWWCVDAWVSDSDDDEGVVVAHINPETLEVSYTNDAYKYDELVRETIADKLREILA